MRARLPRVPDQKTVLITCVLPPPAEQLLREAGFSVVALPGVDSPPRDVLHGRVAGCAGLITVLSDRVDEALLAAAGPALRVVANYAVGYDNIDLAACTRQRVRVSNTPGVLTDATADITWALILAAARHVVRGDRLIRSGQWRGWSATQMLGLELRDAVIGIVGAGRIGTAVGERAVGFGAKLLYTHPRPCPPLDLIPQTRRVDLDELLRSADVITLHIPMRPENRHLLDAQRLKLLRPGAILINTARGPIVDEAALLNALRAGQLAAAGFDVYEHEPRLTPGLSELENVVLLPHLGSATHAARQKMSRMAAENVIAVLSGREPLNPLN